MSDAKRVEDSLFYTQRFQSERNVHDFSSCTPNNKNTIFPRKRTEALVLRTVQAIFLRFFNFRQFDFSTDRKKNVFYTRHDYLFEKFPENTYKRHGRFLRTGLEYEL